MGVEQRSYDKKHAYSIQRYHFCCSCEERRSLPELYSGDRATFQPIYCSHFPRAVVHHSARYACDRSEFIRSGVSSLTIGTRLQIPVAHQPPDLPDVNVMLFLQETGAVASMIKDRPVRFLDQKTLQTK